MIFLKLSRHAKLYHIMRSYDLHLHNFPETFKGHKMRRLQQYFGSPDCGHRCHLSSACLHNPLMYSTNMQQIQNASAHKYLLSTNTRTNLLLLILLQYRIFIWPRSIKVRKILVFLVKLQKWGSCADKYKYGKNQNTNKDSEKNYKRECVVVVDGWRGAVGSGACREGGSDVREPTASPVTYLLCISHGIAKYL